jgi:hypothetical protein
VILSARTIPVHPNSCYKLQINGRSGNLVWTNNQFTTPKSPFITNFVIPIFILNNRRSRQTYFCWALIDVVARSFRYRLVTVSSLFVTNRMNSHRPHLNLTERRKADLAAMLSGRFFFSGLLRNRRRREVGCVFWVIFGCAFLGNRESAGDTAVSVTGYDNVHIRVSDPAKAVDWYVKLLGGCSPTAGQVYFRKALIAVVNTRNPQPSSGSVIDHIGLSFADLDARVRDCEAAGEKILSRVFVCS